MDGAVAHGLPLKRRLRAGPADVAYVEAGRRGAPPVVLLHGFPTSSHVWRHVVAGLGDVHALAPDLMGMGDTAVSAFADLGAPMQAAVVLEWLDRLGIDRVAVVGHGHGGAVAQQLLLTSPERVTHLGLVASVAHGAWPDARPAELLGLARGATAGTATWAVGWRRHGPTWWDRHRARRRAGLDRFVHDPACLPAVVADEHLRPLDGPDGQERALRFLAAGGTSTTAECVPALRAWPGPALVVCGADDPVLSPSWSSALVDDLAGADRLHLLPWCGHLVPEEAPGALAALLRSLLARRGV